MTWCVITLWNDIIFYDMFWDIKVMRFDITSYVMILHVMIQYDICCDVIWYDMMRDNVVIWYNMIWYMMRDNIVKWYDILYVMTY